jgi:hypothetical protein
LQCCASSERIFSLKASSRADEAVKHDWNQKKDNNHKRGFGQWWASFVGKLWSRD